MVVRARNPRSPSTWSKPRNWGTLLGSSKEVYFHLHSTWSSIPTDFPYSLSPLLSQRETAQGFNSPALKKKKRANSHGQTLGIPPVATAWGNHGQYQAMTFICKISICQQAQSFNCLLNGKRTHAETAWNKFQVLSAKPYICKVMLFQIKIINNLAMFTTKILKTIVLSRFLDLSFIPLIFLTEGLLCAKTDGQWQFLYQPWNLGLMGSGSEWEHLTQWRCMFKMAT